MSAATAKTFEKAVRIVGGQSAAGRICGVAQQSIGERIQRGRPAAASWCIPLERATRAAGEEVSRHDLLPDVYPHAEKHRRSDARTHAGAR